MIISDHKTLMELQNEFRGKFPYLKIEFYRHHHEQGEGSDEKTLIDNSKTIGEVRKIHKEGDLSINGHLKVANLEKAFHDIYGLNVQVFRKSGGTWLQTTATDEWTLSEQNNRAEKYAK